MSHPPDIKHTADKVSASREDILALQTYGVNYMLPRLNNLRIILSGNYTNVFRRYHMTITLTLTELLIGLLIIAGIGVLISLMVLIIKAIPGVKHLTKIMENAATLTDDGVLMVAEAKEAVGVVKGTVTDVMALASANKGKVKGAVDLAKAVASLKGLADAFRSKEEEETKSKSTASAKKKKK